MNKIVVMPGVREVKGLNEVEGGETRPVTEAGLTPGEDLMIERRMNEARALNALHAARALSNIHRQEQARRK